MNFTQSREQTNENFMKWWHGEKMERPNLYLIGRDKETMFPKEPDNLRDYYLDAGYQYEKAKAIGESVTYYGEALPYINLDLGPGSVASYLGCEPVFAPDTVWYKPSLKNDDLGSLEKLVFDPENYWWKEHTRQIRELRRLVGKEAYQLTIPDLMSNVDVLSSICEPQQLCYFLLDEPELIKEFLNQIDDAYGKYYDACYNIVKDENGASANTMFYIWSKGRTAKVQCDFGALLSPAQYEEFVMPSLEKDVNRIDYTLYHLDGSCCARHVDTVLQLKNLKALQYTPDVGAPDAADSYWFPLYDKVRNAGKNLWIAFTQGDISDWIRKSEALVNHYGNDGLYFIYPVMDGESAKRLYDLSFKGFRK